MTNEIDKHLDVLFKLKTNVKAVADKEKLNRKEVDAYLKQVNKFTPRSWYQQISTGIADLDYRLKQKYNGIVTRCNGRNNNKYHNHNYFEMNYLPIHEWVELCNENKELLKQMWNNYINQRKDNRYAISVDRIDDNKGYTKRNIQFVTHGFNAWKRNLTPLSVTHNGQTKYFMSGEEAGTYYDIRKQSVSDMLRGQKRLIAKDYNAQSSNIDIVLKENNVNTLEEYYNKNIGDIGSRKAVHA